MFFSRYEPVEQPPDPQRDWSRHDAVTGTGYTFGTPPLPFATRTPVPDQPRLRVNLFHSHTLVALFFLVFYSAGV